MYSVQLTGDEHQDGLKLRQIAEQLDQLTQCPAWEEFMQDVAALQKKSEDAMGSALTADIALKACTAFAVLRQIQQLVPSTREAVNRAVKELGAGKLR